MSSGMADIAHSHRIPLHITEINTHIFNKSDGGSDGGHSNSSSNSSGSSGGGNSSSRFIFILGKIISPLNLLFPSQLLIYTGAIH